MESDPNAADLQSDLAGRIGDLDVEVSARYGAWDGQTIVASQWDWIEQPVAETA